MKLRKISSLWLEVVHVLVVGMTEKPPGSLSSYFILTGLCIKPQKFLSHTINGLMILPVDGLRDFKVFDYIMYSCNFLLVHRDDR